MKRILFSVGLVLGLGMAAQAAQRTVIASATPVLVATGAGQVYAVILSSGANYAVLRDSATANASSTPLIPQLALTSSPQVFKFDPPIRFNNGLSLNLGAGNATEGITVIYQTGRYQ